MTLVAVAIEPTATNSIDDATYPRTSYLSLPSEVYMEDKAPSPETLAQCVGRYRKRP